MKIISLSTHKEIVGLVHDKNPKQIQEVLNEPKLLQAGYPTFSDAQKYAEPLLIGFKLCFFQKENMSSIDLNQYYDFFSGVPENYVVTGVFTETENGNQIYVLRDINSDVVILNKSTLLNEFKNVTIKDFVKRFLMRS